VAEELSFARQETWKVDDDDDNDNNNNNNNNNNGARASVVGWGTMLQAGKLWGGGSIPDGVIGF
jgi:hypothetical protein